MPYAAHIRADGEIKTKTVGLITHPLQAEEIFNDGHADLIAMGREALANSNWGLHAARSLSFSENFEKWPKQSEWWLGRRAARSDLFKLT